MKLAIVGSEERTRDLAPWNDTSYDIWVLNEYVSAFWCKRFTASLQIHPESVYTSPYNDKDTNYWNWLQEKHDKPVYMQEVDPRVPDSVRYPLDEINKEYISTLTWDGMKVKNFTASCCYAVALGLYLGYEQIDIYGIELVYDLQYRKQQPNFAFWVGVATGRKVPVNLHCSRGLFDQPLYGYEEYMEYKTKLESYLSGLLEQEEDAKKKLAMIQGAIQLAKQLIDEEGKTEDDTQKREEINSSQ